MKKFIDIKKILMILAIVGTSIACNESFIDLAPISNANVNSYYRTQSDFETAIIGVYSTWQSLFSMTWTNYCEFRSDTYRYHQATWYEIDQNKFETNTTSDLWNSLYNIITYSNIILDKIDDVEFDDEVTRITTKAEARFFRGWSYFALIRFFGAVPLVDHEITSTEALEIGRTETEIIFSFVEDDLEFAIENLPSTVDDTDYGRLTKYAAEGILARIYIFQSGDVYNANKWEDAKPLLEDIINTSPYGFADTYQEIFPDDGSNEKGKEIILSALFKGGSEGEASAYYNFLGPYQNSGWGGLDIFEDDVLESYEDGDLRKDINVAENYTSINGTFWNLPTNTKFDYLYNSSSGNSGMDFPVLRYTDVYLLYAETLAEIAGNVPSQSLDILNKVRTRAGLVSLTTNDVSSIEMFRTVMQRERRSEFMFECVRWFDLVRTGLAVEVLNALGKDADDTWLLLPIPLTEIDKVGSDILPQNPGY